MNRVRTIPSKFMLLFLYAGWGVVLAMKVLSFLVMEVTEVML